MTKSKISDQKIENDKSQTIYHCMESKKSESKKMNIHIDIESANIPSVKAMGGEDSEFYY